MLNLLRTNSQNPDFVTLVRLLDAELSQRDGDDHPFYAQFNKIDKIRYVVLAYDNDLPVGCGAIKEYEPSVAEVKRMFVPPDYRGKGIASEVLLELEKWAGELSFTKCILETGIRQPEAIGLYQKSGYIRIPNYGQYEEVDNSVCFEKYMDR